MKLYIFPASFHGGASFATTANSKEEAIEQIKAKVASNKDDVNLVENSFGNLDEPEEFVR